LVRLIKEKILEKKKKKKNLQAFKAIKPESLPINLTRPIPLKTDLASRWAAKIGAWACSIAVSKPKVLST